MPVISTEEAHEGIRTGHEADYYLVNGFIINGFDGAECWSQWFTAPELGLTIDFDISEEDRRVRAVDEEARLLVWQQQQEGRHGVLFISLILQMRDGVPVVVNGFAVYGDDPSRKGGERDLNRPWEPPAGFDGTEARRPFPIVALAPHLWS